MISASGVELRAGARVLIESATFRITKGDRIGLVGRNGAGKTTLTKVLAGEGTPPAAPSPAPARSAISRRTRAPAISTCWPATASCPHVVWTP